MIFHKSQPQIEITVVYYAGDTVHWQEINSVVDYDRMGRRSEIRRFFGVIQEVGDFGMIDGAARAHVSKFEIDEQGKIVEKGYAIIDAGQVVPPGYFGTL